MSVEPCSDYDEPRGAASWSTIPSESCTKVEEARSEIPSLKSLTTFEGSEVQLAGVPLSSALRQGCVTFKNSSVRKLSPCEQAVECESLAAFISHNWITSRWLKCFALYFHFNFDIAATASVAWMVGVGMATSFGIFPEFYRGVFPWPVGVVGQATFVPVFMISLFFCQDVAWALGIQRGTLVFVDKLCIDQKNEERKKQGIMRLGAYIHHSKTMVVLYTELYLKKLWTVYEVAAFSTRNSLDQMKILPMEKNLAFMAVMLNSYPFLAVRALILSLGIELSWTRYIGYIVTGWTYIFVSRYWYKRSARLRLQVENFNLHDTVCAQDEDRPTVYGNIVALLKGIGKVPENTTDEAALQSFQDMVRSTMPDIFMPNTFKLNYLYKHYVALGMVHGFETWVDAWAGFHKEDVSKWYFFAVSLDHIVRFLWFIPCAACVIEYIAYSKLHLQGWRQFVFLVGTWFFTLLVPSWVMDTLWQKFIIDQVDEKNWVLLIGLAQLATVVVERRVIMHFSGEQEFWSWKFHHRTPKAPTSKDQTRKVPCASHLSWADKEEIVEESNEFEDNVDDEFIGWPTGSRNITFV